MKKYSRTIKCGCVLNIDYPETDEEIEQMDLSNPIGVTLSPCSPVCNFYYQIIDIVNEMTDDFIQEVKALPNER